MPSPSAAMPQPVPCDERDDAVDIRVVGAARPSARPRVGGEARRPMAEQFTLVRMPM